MNEQCSRLSRTRRSHPQLAINLDFVKRLVRTLEGLQYVIINVFYLLLEVLSPPSVSLQTGHWPPYMVIDLQGVERHF